MIFVKAILWLIAAGSAAMTVWFAVLAWHEREGALFESIAALCIAMALATVCFVGLAA